MGFFNLFKKKEPDFGVQEESLKRLYPEKVSDDELGLPRSRFADEQDFSQDIRPGLSVPAKKEINQELINAKLDAIISKLELMDKRLQEIERIAKE